MLEDFWLRRYAKKVEIPISVDVETFNQRLKQTIRPSVGWKTLFEPGIVGRVSDGSIDVFNYVTHYRKGENVRLRGDIAFEGGKPVFRGYYYLSNLARYSLVFFTLILLLPIYLLFKEILTGSAGDIVLALWVVCLLFGFRFIWGFVSILLMKKDMKYIEEVLGGLAK